MAKMRNWYLKTCMVFVQFCSIGLSSLVITSIDSGFDSMQLENGAEIERYFTKLTLPKPRCVVSLRVDTIQPLTGAEDIEILYRECPRKTKWKIIHYHSHNSTFLLNEPIPACELSLVSPRLISIIDFTPKTCPPELQTSFYSSCFSSKDTSINHSDRDIEIDEEIADKNKRLGVPFPYPLPEALQLIATKPIRIYRRKLSGAKLKDYWMKSIKFVSAKDPTQKTHRNRKRRHHHHLKPTKLTKIDQNYLGINAPKFTEISHKVSARNYRRIKRQTRISGSYELANSRIIAADSPYQVVSDLEVPEGVTLTVEKGVKLLFHPEVGITVKGRLVAEGTPEQPIWMVPFLSGTYWKGLTFQENYDNYKLRLVHSSYGTDGYLEVFNKLRNSWQLVCGDGWTQQSAQVACKQLGFSQGALVVQTQPSGVAVPQGTFWITRVQCAGTETGIDQCPKTESQSSFCQSTAAFVACQGQAEKLTQKPSVLAHLNVTGTQYGIKIRGRMPRMSSVLSQFSQGHGMDIVTHYDPQHVYSPEIFKATLVRNQLSGISLDMHYPTKVFYNPKITIYAMISTSNVKHGMEIRGRGSISLRQNTYFHNSLNGAVVELESGSLISVDDLSASNNRYGMELARDSNNRETLEIQIMKCNMTGHFFGSAVVLSVGENAKFSIDQCHMFENYNGAITADRLSVNKIDIRSNNFTRNRGKIVRFSGIGPGTEVNVLRNLFSLNLLSNYSEKQSVLDFGYSFGNLENTQLIVAENLFLKNNIPHVIIANDSYRQPTNGILHIQGNEFRENLSPDVLVLDVKRANVTYNVFENSIAKCEVMSGNSRPNSDLFAQNNFWSSVDESRVKTRVCDSSQDETLSTISYLPFLSSESEIRNRPLPRFPTISDSVDESSGSINTGNGNEGGTGGDNGIPSGNSGVTTQTPDANAGGENNVDNSLINTGNTEFPLINSGNFNSVGAKLNENSSPIGNANLGEKISGTLSADRTLVSTPNPYQATEEIVVPVGTKLTLNEGSTVVFANGAGLRVEGQLIIRGTQQNPVILSSVESQNWNGIIFNSKNGSYSSLENCIIDNALHAVLLNSEKVRIKNCVIRNPVYDGITITDSSGEVLELEDLTIKGSRDKGIRVTNKQRAVNLRRINIQDSQGHGIDFDNPVMNISLTSVHIRNSKGYAIRIDQMKYSRQSIIINALEIVNHRNGPGGIYINARDYLSIVIRNSNFYENTVPSLIVSLKCNYTGNYVPVAPVFLMENNIFSNNTQTVASVSLMYCTKANISGNTFVRNNQNFLHGSLKLMPEPAREYGKQNFRINLARNMFRDNYGAFCVYILPMSIYEFHGVFTGNRLIGNRNRRAGLIAGTPYLTVNLNEFQNAQSSYELELEYNDNKILDATQNYWGTNQDMKIRSGILDYFTIPQRGIVQYRPFLTRDSPELPQCPELNNCNGKGQCIAENVCSCIPGYANSDCSTSTCAELNNCNNNGRCTGPNLCQCVAGWAGNDCAIPSCGQLKNCSGNGQCVSLNECLCRKGFTGEDCSRPICGINACSGHGSCDSAEVSCVCSQGWKGVACELPDCSAVNGCSGNGNCIAPRRCQCFEGYSGPSCSVGSTNGCQVSGCNYHGKCELNGQCTCDKGWTGSMCQSAVGCDTTGCSGYGTCQSDGQCLCLDGWVGTVCDQIDCTALNQCSGHGRCTGPNQCSCDPSYGGEDCSECPNCSIDSCGFTGCSNNGECQNNGQCLCDFGWTGQTCKEPICVNDCSGKGSCVAPGQCQCNAGFTAEDCSLCIGENCEGSCQILGCSGNGVCEANGKCLCNLDYNGARCDVPDCSQVNNCGGHGRCIEPNLCHCDQGYSGDDCDTCVFPNCGAGDDCGTTRCSGHGKCSEGGGCLCEQGWGGLRCENAECSEVKRCSNRGVCVGPNKCECIKGYTGSDCSICTLPSCTSIECTFQCVHGVCDTTTGSCRCDPPWSGAACDVCSDPFESGTCDLPKSVLFSVLPSSGPTQNQDSAYRVNAIGKNFLKSSDNLYECIFGSFTSTGIWQSTSLISCELPIASEAESVAFSVRPSDGTKVSNYGSSLIQFTFYPVCRVGQCTNTDQGSCVEGSCICRAEFFGQNCQRRAEPAIIDLEFVNLPESTTAKEGVGYQVQLKLGEPKPVNPVTWNILQSPEGMTLNPETGLLLWEKPVGSSTPVPITVSANSLEGTTQITWTLDVPISYKPQIESITPSANGGGTEIFGTAGYNSNNTIPLGSIPVKVRVFNNNELAREWIVMTDDKGKFETEFQVDSFEESGKFVVTAVHPGMTEIAVPDWADQNAKTWTIPGLKIDISDEVKSFDGKSPVDILLILQNSGTLPLNGFETELLNPKEKVSIRSVVYSDAFTQNLASDFNLMPLRSVTATVSLQINDADFNGFVTLQVGTSQGVKRVIATKIARVYGGAKLIAFPGFLNITSSMTNPNPNVDVIIRNVGNKSVNGIKIPFQRDSPLFLVSMESANEQPANQDFKPGNEISVIFGILPANVNLLNKMEDNMTVTDFDDNQLLLIPYEISNEQQETFNLEVTVVDENTFKVTNSPLVDGATLKLMNPAKGISDLRYSTSEGPVVFLSVKPESYYLTVEKQGYNTVEQTLYASHTNRKLTVFLPLANVEQHVKIIQHENGTYGLVLNTKLIDDKIVFLVPTPAEIEFDNLDKLDQTGKTIRIGFKNTGDSTIFPHSLNVTGNHLPFVLTMPDPLPSISPGETLTFPVTVKPSPSFAGSKGENCDAYLLNHQFSYEINGKEVKRSTKFLVKNRKYQTKEIVVCEITENNNGNFIVEPHPLVIETRVSCNCLPDAELQCSQLYTQAAPCGDVTNEIPETPGFQALLQIVNLVTSCNRLGIHLDDVQKAVRCYQKLPNACPNSATSSSLSRRKKRAMAAWQGPPFLTHIQLAAEINGALGSPVGPLPLFETGGPSTETILMAFTTFFDGIHNILGVSSSSDLSHGWFDKFRENIADLSPGGIHITLTEVQEILSTVSICCSQNFYAIEHFVTRWNETVKAWNAGLAGPDSNGANFVDYGDLTQFLNTTAAIHLFSTQASQKNLFKLLDSQLQSTSIKNLNTTPACAMATVLVTPGQLIENEPFSILVNVTEISTNLNEVSITLKIDPVEAGQISFDQSSPLTSQIAVLDGSATALQGSTFSVEWKDIIPVADSILIKPTHFYANIDLSFSANGKQTTRRLDMQTLVFYPKPTLKVFYFLYQNIYPAGTQRNHSFDIMIGLLNSGYTDWHDLKMEQSRLKVVEPSDNERMAEYGLESTKVNGELSERNFNQEISSLQSGSSAFITYNLTSKNNAAYLVNFSATVLHGADLISLADERAFSVFKMLDNTLLVSSLAETEPRYRFDIKNGGLFPIEALSFEKSESKTVEIDGKSFWSLSVDMLQTPNADLQKSPVFAYGKFELFAPPADGYQFMFGRKNGQNLPVSHVWFTKSDVGNDIVHIADPSFAFKPGNLATTYELIYSNRPNQPPIFDQDRYEVTLPLNGILGTEVLNLEVSNGDGSSSIVKYELYGGDGKFSIHEKTGQILLVNPLASEDTICLTVTAKNDGVHLARTDVPITVYINSQGAVNCDVMTDLESQNSYTHSDVETTVVTPGFQTTEKPIAEASTTTALPFSSTTAEIFTPKLPTTINTTKDTGEIIDASPSTEKKPLLESTLKPDYGSTETIPTTVISVTSPSSNASAATKTGVTSNTSLATALPGTSVALNVSAGNPSIGNTTWSTSFTTISDLTTDAEMTAAQSSAPTELAATDAFTDTANIVSGTAQIRETSNTSLPTALPGTSVALNVSMGNPNIANSTQPTSVTEQSTTGLNTAADTTAAQNSASTEIAATDSFTNTVAAASQSTTSPLLATASLTKGQVERISSPATQAPTKPTIPPDDVDSTSNAFLPSIHNNDRPPLGVTGSTGFTGPDIIDGIDITELDDEKLARLACKMRNTKGRNKQVWGVICDLGKVNNR